MKYNVSRFPYFATVGKTSSIIPMLLKGTAPDKLIRSQYINRAGDCLCQSHHVASGRGKAVSCV